MRFRSAIVVPALVLSFLAAAGCARNEAATSEAAPPAPQVSVAQVVSRPVTDFDEFTGRFVAVERVEVRPRVAGYIASVAFTPGREVKQGETVGYAAAWRAERDSSIAILAAGYGDGLPRHLANGTPVLIAGARYPLVGRVSMDMIAVDVTGAPKVATGNRAIVWGEGLPVEEVAAHASTVPYELLCGVSQRVPLELR